MANKPTREQKEKSKDLFLEKVLIKLCLAVFCSVGMITLVACSNAGQQLPTDSEGKIDIVAAVDANLIDVTKVTGGGWLPSTIEDGGKANLGFVINTCDPANPKGNFNFHDLSYTPSVKAKSKIDGLYQPALGECLLVDGTDLATTCTGGTQALAVFDYKSKNKKDAPGTGKACVCMDSLSFDMQITFISGPFDGYSNSGSLKGNINNHGCDEDV